LFSKTLKIVCLELNQYLKGKLLSWLVSTRGNPARSFSKRDLSDEPFPLPSLHVLSLAAGDDPEIGGNEHCGANEY